MSWSVVVQILSGVALFAGLVAGAVLFYKALSRRDTQQKVFKQFLLMEFVLLITAACGFILLWGWPKSISGFIILSVLMAFLANLPMAILVKLFMLVFPCRGNENDKDSS
jgi:flagellar biosynthesis component FlhA